MSKYRMCWNVVGGGLILFTLASVFPLTVAQFGTPEPEILVFVIGGVRDPGEVRIQGDRVSLVDALIRAGGPIADGVFAQSRIIRIREDGTTENVAVDVDRILKGQDPGVAMMANDILFVPTRVSLRDVPPQDTPLDCPVTARQFGAC